MYNFNQKTLKIGLIHDFNTRITIKSMEDLSPTFGNELPFPQYHWITQSTWDNKTRYYYQFVIDGVFDTKKGINYLNDIVARIMITFPKQDIEKVKQEKIPAKKRGLKLKTFQNLKSMKSLPSNFLKANLFTNKDNVFWALKLAFEVQIERGNISYDTFETFAFNNFEHRVKDRSTLKAKCRNIYNWYFDRSFEVTKRRKYKDFNEYKEQSMATRQQQMKKINEKRKEESYRKIVGLISGLTSFEYKSKNGSWNISKIAKDLKITRPTVYKYIQEYEKKF